MLNKSENRFRRKIQSSLTVYNKELDANEQ
jgi:hypothetical protein